MRRGQFGGTSHGELTLRGAISPLKVLIRRDAKNNDPPGLNVEAFTPGGPLGEQLVQFKRKVPVTSVGVTAEPLIVDFALLFCRNSICAAC